MLASQAGRRGFESRPSLFWNIFSVVPGGGDADRDRVGLRGRRIELVPRMACGWRNQKAKGLFFYADCPPLSFFLFLEFFFDSPWQKFFFWYSKKILSEVPARERWKVFDNPRLTEFSLKSVWCGVNGIILPNFLFSPWKNLHLACLYVYLK